MKLNSLYERGIEKLQSDMNIFNILTKLRHI